MMFFLKQYPTYLSVLELSAYLGHASMVRYYTQYGTTDFVCCSCNHTSRTKKYGSTMVISQPQGGFAISQSILLRFLIPYERRHPYNRALMMIWSDLHGKEKPLSSPSWEIIDSDFGHLQILTIREEEQVHFWPFQLCYLTPSISLDDGRKWGFL